MARFWIVSAVALLTVTAVLVYGAPVCSEFTLKKDCLMDRSCDWCGSNVTNATGHPGWAFCYNPATSPGKCCAGALPDAGAYWFCQPQASLCAFSDVCASQNTQTTYGNCPDTKCCPRDSPQNCNGNCIAADAHCCGYGTACNATQACCGQQFGAICCPAKASCCDAPDGEAHWCCPQNQQCTISPYFGCSGGPPTGMAKRRP